MFQFMSKQENKIDKILKKTDTMTLCGATNQFMNLIFLNNK